MSGTGTKSAKELVDDALNAQQNQIDKIDAELKDKTERLEKINKELTEANDLFNATEAKNNSAIERTQRTLEDTKKELTETLDEIKKQKEILDEEKKQLALDRDTIFQESQKINQTKNDSDQLSSEIESKNLELNRLKSEIDGEKITLEADRKALKQETRQNEELKKQIEATTNLNKKILDGIKKAQADAEVGQQTLRAEAQANELLRNNAISEQSRAEHAKNMASNLITVFRQALHSFIQINGTQIRIDNLTDEHKRFVAETLLSELGETIPKYTEKEILEDIDQAKVEFEATGTLVEGEIGGEKASEEIKTEEGNTPPKPEPEPELNIATINVITKAIKSSENQSELETFLGTLSPEEISNTKVQESIEFVKSTFKA